MNMYLFSIQILQFALYMYFRCIHVSGMNNRELHALNFICVALEKEITYCSVQVLLRYIS